MISIRHIVALALIICVVKSQPSLSSPQKKLYQSFDTIIREIIVKIFINHFPVVNIVTAAKEKTRAGDLINRVLSKESKDFIVRLDSYESIQHIRNRKKRFNVIILDSIESFRVLDRLIKPDVFWFSGYYTFVLIDGKIDEVDEIFSTLWQKNIYNVIVIFEEDVEVKVMGFLPYDGSACGDTTPKLLASSLNGSLDRDQIESIYPDKFGNLRNCPIKIATFEYAPAVIKKKTSNGSIELSGFDMEILSELSKALNFEKEISFMTGPDPWGNLFENGTVTGALGEAVQGKAQIAVGAYFLLQNRLEVVASSVGYFVCPQVFIISPGRKLSSFEKLLQPFDTTVWAFVLVTLLIALIVIFSILLKFKHSRAFVFGTDVRYPVLNLLTAVFGIAQPKLPGRNFSRFLLMMFMILCLVMRSAYQGALFKFLQTDKHSKSVETIDDMVNQEFDLHMSEFQLEIFFENQTQIAARAKFLKYGDVDKFHNTSLNTLDRVAFISSLTDTVEANKRNKDFLAHKVLKEYISIHHFVLYYPKNFYLIKTIDKTVKTFLSAGIVDHIIDKYVDLRYWLVKEEKKEPQKLTVRHLEGAFNVWLICCGISFVCFLMEMLMTTFRTLKLKAMIALRSL